jgi:uncharacterized membrane protein
MNETPLTQEIIDGQPEGAVVAKTGLIASAARHPVLAGGAVLVGAGLAYAAARMIKSADTDLVAREVHVEASIAINSTPAELFSFWRDLKNLPLFMNNLESVVEIDSVRSHWVAKGPAGTTVEWDAEIYNEKESELIAWRSLADADVVNAGSVRFQQAPEGRGTYLRVTMNYNPPAGKAGAALSQLLGSEPAQLIKEDLRRLKQIIEASEIASIDGQSSGRAAGAERIAK